MRILAADTSTSVNTVAVCDSGRILAETIVECGRAHSERLLATVDWVLRESGVALNAIDLLAVSIGPGSFTGVRIGVATWKGLALAANKRLVGVPTLDAMIRLGDHRDGRVYPLLDARMGEVFGAGYELAAGTRKKVIENRVCPVEVLLDAAQVPGVFLGTGAALYRDRILARMPDAVFAEPPASVPRASAVAAEAEALHAAGAESDPAAIVPIYLRPSQAEANRARAGQHG